MNSVMAFAVPLIVLVGAGVYFMNRVESPVLPASSAPRGIRNNNPGNIRWNVTNKWDGQIGKDQDGFVIFSEPVYGIRAMNRTLNSYANAGFKNAVSIIARWDRGVASPNVDLLALPIHTVNYIHYVANKLRVDPMLRLDGRHRAGLIKAIIGFENANSVPYSDALIQQGISMS